MAVTAQVYRSPLTATINGVNAIEAGNPRII